MRGHRNASGWIFHRVAPWLVLLLVACGGGAGRPRSTERRRDPHARTCEVPRGGGELQIYDVMTQIGTVARREIEDAAGRVSATVYYGTRETRIVGPFAADGLVLQSARLHQYDSQGRERRTVMCGPALEVVEIMEVLYGAEGTVTGHRWVSPAGTLRREERAGTQLSYDDTGRGLVGIHGPVPSDVDLAQGWGEPANDVAFGLAATRTTGRAEQIAVSGTLRAGPQATSAVSGFPFLVMQLELRDAAGAVVAQDRALIERRVAELIRMNGGTAENVQTIRAGEAITLDTTVLSEWYTGLEAGRYVLTATRRLRGPTFEIGSNRVELQVVGSRRNRGRTH